MEEKGKKRRSLPGKRAMLIAAAAALLVAAVIGVIDAGRVSAGEIYTFGHYEQDNRPENGPEEIEWIVLERKGDYALLLSRYALDCATFDRHRSGSGWIGSDLRNWLNESFLRNAFDDGERERIRDMEVVSPGEKDLVFLLSTEEAEKYLKSDRSRRCVPTVYCKTQGAWVEDGRCWWWLRSNGMGGYAAVVRSDGVIDKKGDPVAGSKENTVRPAVWIRLGR